MVDWWRCVYSSFFTEMHLSETNQHLVSYKISVFSLKLKNAKEKLYETRKEELMFRNVRNASAFLFVIWIAELKHTKEKGRRVFEQKRNKSLNTWSQGLNREIPYDSWRHYWKKWGFRTSHHIIRMWWSYNYIKSHEGYFHAWYMWSDRNLHVLPYNV